jgi:hypothetical protein
MVLTVMTTTNLLLYLTKIQDLNCNEPVSLSFVITVLIADPS